jgi:hypothetical protein
VLDNELGCTGDLWRVDDYIIVNVYYATMNVNVTSLLHSM